MKKSYVIDTSVLLTNYNSINQFSNNDIVIPFKVLEEIDKHKQRQDGVGSNARMIIRILDRLRNKGNLHNGVRPAKGKGLISIKQYDSKCIDNDLDLTNADNQIIATAITEKQRVGKRKVIVVTRDINMRVKCDALGIPTEDYVSDQVVNNTTELYTGFVNHLVDEQVIDQFYNSEDVFLEKEDIKLFPNQFVMLVSSSNNKKTALAKFVSYNSPLKRVPEYKNGIWGLKPRNKEQMFSINLLLDSDVPIVTIIGKAGCGKTLVALAAGLEQVI